MSERESNVYKAKLAEQAERYDGEQDIFQKFLCNFFLLDAKKMAYLVNEKRRRKKYVL